MLVYHWTLPLLLNIFGRRQDPNGAYAAVILKWFAGLMAGEEILITENE